MVVELSKVNMNVTSHTVLCKIDNSQLNYNLTQEDILEPLCTGRRLRK